jgi:hypothetical protein
LIFFYDCVFGLIWAQVSVGDFFFGFDIEIKTHEFYEFFRTLMEAKGLANLRSWEFCMPEAFY